MYGNRYNLIKPWKNSQIRGRKERIC